MTLTEKIEAARTELAFLEQQKLDMDNAPFKVCVQIFQPDGDNFYTVQHTPVVPSEVSNVLAACVTKILGDLKRAKLIVK